MNWNEIKAELAAKVPSGALDTLENFAEKGWRPGGFLTAVLENDLMGAFGRADSTNRRRLEDIVAYVYNVTPSAAWGSPEKVEAWIAMGGLEGWKRKKAEEAEEVA